ncbi:MAG: biotin carboxylase N-terminal domain-containing protein [Candidatus Altiarchaeota archaeon]
MAEEKPPKDTPKEEVVYKPDATRFGSDQLKGPETRKPIASEGDIEKIDLGEMKLLIAGRGTGALIAAREAKRAGVGEVHLIVEKLDFAFGQWLNDPSLYSSVTVVDSYAKDEGAIVEVAKKVGANTVWPGMGGFVSESDSFAAKCWKAGIRTTGPNPGVLDELGNKAKAKRQAEMAGLPVTPTQEFDEAGRALLACEKMIFLCKAQKRGGDVKEALAGLAAEKDITGVDWAQDLWRIIDETFNKAGEANVTLVDEADWDDNPLRIKKKTAGGGRGQWVVSSRQEVDAFIKSHSGEARQDTFIGAEGYLVAPDVQNPRHIEVQVASDGRRTVHFGCRECTIQIHRQKLLEESLTVEQYERALAKTDDPTMKEHLLAEKKLLEDIQKDAVKLINSIGYRGIGTVEFLVDEAGRLTFLEVNPRLQVEHGVTEAVTRVNGEKLNLPRLQFELATGKTLDELGITQENVSHEGNAMEGRIVLLRRKQGYPKEIEGYPAIIERFNAPSDTDSVRLEAGGLGEYSGGVPITRYDPMFAQLIVHGEDRTQMIGNADKALQQLKVAGRTRWDHDEINGILDEVRVGKTYTPAEVNAFRRAHPLGMMLFSPLAVYEDVIPEAVNQEVAGKIAKFASNRINEEDTSVSLLRIFLANKLFLGRFEGGQTLDQEDAEQIIGGGY